MSRINIDELDFSDVNILAIHNEGTVVRIEVADPTKEGATLNINVPIDVFNNWTEDQILFEVWKVVNSRKQMADKTKIENVMNKLKQLKGKKNETSTSSSNA